MANGDCNLYSGNMKRRRVSDDCAMTTETGIVRRGSHFLTLHSSTAVYQTEEFKPKGSTLYIPLSEDVMINTSKIDEITFSTGNFFIGNEQGAFLRTEQGCAINMWKFDKVSRKLFVSRSFLFTSEQVYAEVIRSLQEM
ncbi:uncharacterized protein LOC106163089 [Lingula anatina]|uniref:Uncharacterized protein LOC106163089 n=1 Tax=Lingula anatina TaxID=7574 RepID=A0A1S3ICS2_LINAN|nr:uncharacterized protein LOC106163089 [Lingula anatina]|eukprot:XP_013396037.1 uncharacterized protein LOC106163089 [Lingula anatina]